jgi:O-antigen/teichoic acid export membrane protein
MVFSMLLSIVVTPLILKFLNKEEFGLYMTLFQIISYLFLFDFGLGAAISRNLAAHRGSDPDSKMSVNKIISTSFFTYSVLGIIVIVCGVSFAPFIADFFRMSPDLHSVGKSIAMTLSIIVGLQFPLKVFSSIFYAHQKQFLFNTVNFVVNLFNLILPVIFLILGFGLWSFVYTMIICTLINIVITVYLMRKHYPFLRVSTQFFDKTLLRHMFGFGFFIFINSIAGQVVFFSDRFFIGSLVSLSAVAIYSMTAKAPELCRELAYRITDNAYPAMVEINEKEGGNRLKLIHQKLMMITVCFVTIAFWMIYIINFWFIKLWVGADFFAGQAIMLLTLALLLQHTIIHVSAVCLSGAGLVKGFSIMSVFEAIINVVLTIWLGKKFGIAGILTATLIASAITCVWYNTYTIIRYLKMSLAEYLLRPIVIPFIVISIFGLLLSWLGKSIFESVSLNIINFIVVALTLGILLTMFSWFAFLRKEVSAYIPDSVKNYFTFFNKVKVFR